MSEDQPNLFYLSNGQEAMLAAKSPLTREAARRVVDRVTAEIAVEVADMRSNPGSLTAPRQNKVEYLSDLICRVSLFVHGSVSDGAEAILRGLESE